MCWAVRVWLVPAQLSVSRDNIPFKCVKSYLLFQGTVINGTLNWLLGNIISTNYGWWKHRNKIFCYGHSLRNNILLRHVHCSINQNMCISFSLVSTFSLRYSFPFDRGECLLICLWQMTVSIFLIPWWFVFCQQQVFINGEFFWNVDHRIISLA